MSSSVKAAATAACSPHRSGCLCTLLMACCPASRQNLAVQHALAVRLSHQMPVEHGDVDRSTLRCLPAAFGCGGRNCQRCRGGSGGSGCSGRLLHQAAAAGGARSRRRQRSGGPGGDCSTLLLCQRPSSLLCSATLTLKAAAKPAGFADSQEDHATKLPLRRYDIQQYN